MMMTRRRKRKDKKVRFTVNTFRLWRILIQKSTIDSIIEKGREIYLKVKTEKINIFDSEGKTNLVKGVINDYDQYKKGSN